VGGEGKAGSICDFDTVILDAPIDGFDYTQTGGTPTQDPNRLDRIKAKAIFYSMDINAPVSKQDAQFFARRRLTVWPRRDLSAGLSLLFWALRIYVVVMLVVVAIVLHRAAG
jgi:hypothetical protein